MKSQRHVAAFVGNRGHGAPTRVLSRRQCSLIRKQSEDKERGAMWHYQHSAKDGQEMR